MLLDDIAPVVLETKGLCRSNESIRNAKSNFLPF
jgi:hypothetical protein